ncbi:hypothetical protein B0H14DRAFT_2607575 [Mycena olivaceomarginata]|nr:hypothetical protein B0H14DRAFT_2607575 [Mycena olivaceomarginata]
MSATSARTKIHPLQAEKKVPSRHYISILGLISTSFKITELGGRMSSPSNEETNNQLLGMPDGLRPNQQYRVKGEVCNEGAAVSAVTPEEVEYGRISPQWKEYVDRGSCSEDGGGAGAEEHGEGKEG